MDYEKSRKIFIPLAYGAIPVAFFAIYFQWMLYVAIAMFVSSAAISILYYNCPKCGSHIVEKYGKANNCIKCGYKL